MSNNYNRDWQTKKESAKQENSTTAIRKDHRRSITDSPLTKLPLRIAVVVVLGILKDDGDDDDEDDDE
jgi:hypothetical protein